VCIDDLERLTPNRPRGAENGDPFHSRKCTGRPR
jgi:hypothetical protein